MLYHTLATHMLAVNAMAMAHGTLEIPATKMLHICSKQITEISVAHPYIALATEHHTLTIGLLYS